MLVLSFHAALLFFDAWALRLLKGRPPARALARAVLLFLGAMSALALAGMLLESSSRFYGSYFTFMGLFARGLFVHGIALLLIATGRLAQRSRPLALVCAGCAALLGAAAVEGFWLGPRALEVSYHRIESPKLTRPWRAVVIADLQTDGIGCFEREALELALAQEPDLLLLPGDYIQADVESYDRLCAELNLLLHELGFSAPAGIFAVEGNVDRAGWPAIFTGLPVTTFVRSDSTRLEGLVVTGLSFSDSFRSSLSVPPVDGFQIVLGHAPDFALGRIEADLLVAGHTHGGQVRIPGFGPPFTLSRVPRSWAAGRTDLAGARTLIVSRGIGMERGLAPRVRFFCRPEIVVLDLLPAR